MFLACLRGASHSGCAMLSMAVSTVLFRQLNPQCCSGPLYFNPSTHYVNPSRQPINPSKAKASTTTHPSISLLLAGSKALKRPLVRKPMGHPLGLNPAGVLLFRNRALGGAAESTVLLRATAKASTPFHPHPSIHLSLFAFSWFEGAETAPGPQTNWPPLGRESCSGSAVSQPCPRRCFCSRIHGVAQSRGQSFHIPPYSTPIHPSIHLFAFSFYSWFEGAETAPGPQTNGPPLGPESCWGSAVPQPCPGRCFCSRIHGAAQGHGQSFHPPSIHPSIHPSLFAFSWFEGAETAPGPQTTWPPLGRESCWGSAVSEPCPRRCFRSRIHGAAQGRYIKRSTAKASTSFHPHPSIPSIHIHPSIHPSIHLFAFSWFEGAETAPGPQTNGPPLGPESCWGSAVSQPRCFCSRLHGAAQGHGQSFHPIPPPSIHPSIHLSLLLAGSKVLKRPLVRRPIGHPLRVNPAGVLLFRNRAL